MNAKQTAPLLVTLAAVAPPLLIGGAIGLGIVLLVKEIFDGDAEKQPETKPGKPGTETSKKPTETAVFRQNPAPIRPKLAPVVSVARTPRVTVQPAPVSPVSVAPVPVQPVVPVVKTALSAAPKPVARRFVTRADLVTIFDNGKRALSRTVAVTALKRLGFGKSAAYAALSPDGRFSSWLFCAPDGIISWTEGQKE
jgi:hypothetical protein